ncbi:hypothetical protein [Cupriavidus malaysiensis]|nr:hypothetical protein [Cupriavidus malaysiensis]
MIFRILLDGAPAYTGPFPTWWDAYASAFNRAALAGAHCVKVKRA